LAYSESRHASKITHLHWVYTCTFAILFFGTPHHGSSKARLLGSLQKLASLAIPRGAVQIESSLVNALEEESETLQNITDQFAPLMSNFRIFFLWEQEKTDLKYTKDYIVDQTSAAPLLNDTERCGIAADHRGMCKFKTSTSQGFSTVVAALRRYCQEAPQVIRSRWIRTADMLNETRRQEAMEMLGIIDPQANYAVPPNSVNRIEGAPTRRKILNDVESRGSLAENLLSQENV
jgi:protein SERAC1